MNISPARIAAYDILFRIETENAFSSVLLPIYEADLSVADRSLCHEITLGTLRRQMSIDRIIDSLAGGKKLDAEVRIALRLGLYQLNFLDRVPQYSAINESVNLVQYAKKTSAKGFVNAVLRRSVREKTELTFTDETEQLSVETSHPRWLIEKWIKDLGAENAKRLAVANNVVPRAAFRLTANAKEETQKFVETVQPSRFVDGCFLADRHDKRLFDLATLGEIYFQDEASQMMALAVQIPAGGRFLDVCASPGGKTGLIAMRHSTPSGLLAAGDRYWPRVEFLRENCRRQGVGFVKIAQYDAAYALPFAAESFDVVVVDAPCSGTGTIRHNPEIRYSLTQKDIDELPAKQLAILKNASKIVRPAGTLIYSTCSVEKEENEQVCREFLQGDATYASVSPAVDSSFLTENGFARTWPHRDGMDGFFIASYKRAIGF